MHAVFSNNSDSSKPFKLFNMFSSSCAVLMYSFVNENLDNKNLTTYEFLKELKEAGYKNSAAIFRELYAWNVSMVVYGSTPGNSKNVPADSEKTITGKSSYNEKDNINVYLAIKVTGGEPGEKYRFYVNERLKESWRLVVDEYEWADSVLASDEYYIYSVYKGGSDTSFTVSLYHNDKLIKSVSGKRVVDK